MTDATPNPDSSKANSVRRSSGTDRRWTIFPASFLLLALGLVVMFTSRTAFFSPLSMVVIAAIGLAALLLQLRLRRDIGAPVHAPVWLNVLGLACALTAIFGDWIRPSAGILQVASLAAVVCFAISGIVVLHALRKQRAEQGLPPAPRQDA